MNRIKTLAACIGIISCTVSIAQDTTHTQSLDDVVITATKYPVKLSQTGKVVTVINQQQLERSAGKDLSQLLNEQTGITITGANGSAGKEKSIFMRGAKNSYTLILIDGIPTSDPSSLLGGALDLRLIPLDQIERIEILKGSQSSLYGSDAVAGVINIITKKGGDKKINGSAIASYGSYNTSNANANIYGTSGIVDYNINYSYTNTDGISEAKDTTGKQAFDKDGFNRNSFQSNFTFKVAKNLKLSPFYRYNYLKGDMDEGAFVDSKDIFTYLTNNAGISGVYQLPKGSITANYSYLYAKRDYQTTWGAYYYTARFNNADAYINYPLNDQVQFLAGATYQQYNMPDNPTPSDVTLVSPYASVFIQSGTGLNVEIGGRYNHHSKFGSFSTYSLNTSYNVNSNLKFFANISTGFKSPSTSQLFGAFGANPDLKPEKSNNLEGGVQFNALEQKVHVTATAFSREITDVIDWVNSKYINIDNQNDKGIELEANIKPCEKLNIKASYTYVTGEITQRREGKDTTFYNLLRVPKNAFVLNVGYDVTKNLHFDLSLQTVGKRDDQYFSSSTFSTESVSLKSYALFNAYAEYKLNNTIRLFADVKNITNSKYYEVYGYGVQGFNVTTGIQFKL